MADELKYSGGYYRLNPQKEVEMQHLWKVMDDLKQSIINSGADVDAVIALLAGYVQSVTDDGNGVVTIDNTDTQNPVVQFAGVNVDGVTVTGDGTAGNPLVAVVPASVESVTDDGNGAVTVDNTDPLNPVIGFSAQVDGLTIDGDGTTATPLEAKFVTLGVQASVVSHTGTAAETILYALQIPGGTIGNNDKLLVHAIFRKNSGSGGFTVRARLHTANAVAGTPIGNNVISTAGNTCRIMSEQWWQNANNSSIGYPTGGGSFQSTWGANYVTTALDNTADIYVLLTGQLATSGDTAELSSARVELYKY